MSPEPAPRWVSVRVTRLRTQQGGGCAGRPEVPAHAVIDDETEKDQSGCGGGRGEPEADRNKNPISRSAGRTISPNRTMRTSRAAVNQRPRRDRRASITIKAASERASTPAPMET